MFFRAIYVEQQRSIPELHEPAERSRQRQRHIEFANLPCLPQVAGYAHMQLRPVAFLGALLIIRIQDVEWMHEHATGTEISLTAAILLSRRAVLVAHVLFVR